MMAKGWSYLQVMIGDYEAGRCEAALVALYVVRKVLAQDEVSLPELPDWLSSELQQLIAQADQGSPIQTISNAGLEDHTEIVRKFSMVLKNKGISV